MGQRAIGPRRPQSYSLRTRRTCSRPWSEEYPATVAEFQKTGDEWFRVQHVELGGKQYFCQRRGRRKAKVPDCK